MDEMVSSDRRRIAVSLDRNHLQVGPGHLEARGYRRGSSVQDVEVVKFEVPRQVTVTPDPADQNGLLLIQPQPFKCLQKGIPETAVSASFAPRGRQNTCEKIFLSYFIQWNDFWHLGHLLHFG